jgi:hypothetical protein
MQSTHQKDPPNLSYVIASSEELKCAYLSVPTHNYMKSIIDKAKYLKNMPLIYHSLNYNCLVDFGYLNFIQQLNALHIIDCKEINTEVAMRYKSLVKTNQLHNSSLSSPNYLKNKVACAECIGLNNEQVEIESTMKSKFLLKSKAYANE